MLFLSLLGVVGFTFVVFLFFNSNFAFASNAWHFRVDNFISHYFVFWVLQVL